jgi:hypothetical protein
MTVKMSVTNILRESYQLKKANCENLKEIIPFLLNEEK